MHLLRIVEIFLVASRDTHVDIELVLNVIQISLANVYLSYKVLQVLIE